MAGRGKDGEPTIPHLAVSLATLFPHQIIESNLPGRAKEIPPVLGNQYSNLWRRLRVENAPLRILRDDALASAPISFFDPPPVMSHVMSEAAMVIGNALVDIWDTALYQTDNVGCPSSRARHCWPLRIAG